MTTTTVAIERTVDHRPWPMPAGPWIMFQSWQRLLFAHWRVPEERLRPHVPEPLAVDTFDGSAWVALTPFALKDLHGRGLPALPGASDFLEMNLRTYVRYGDRPGIYFFTLEASSLLAVTAARALFRLPYRHARMRSAQHGEWIEYRSTRVASDAEFAARYRPTGAVFAPAPGTAEHFLTERYALYTVLRDRRVLRVEIHHRPWSLQSAEARIEHNTIAAAHGIDLGETPALLHYAARQDTLVWGPRILH